MQSYSERRTYADTFLPCQLNLLSELFNVPAAAIQVADDHTDRAEATDAIIGDNRIALRVRRPDQIRYANEITIRTTTTNGNSEWAKVQRGLVRYMLYGFAADVGEGLQRWTLVDLRRLELGQGVETTYGGGSFLAFNLADCRNAVVASGEAVAAPPTAAQADQLWAAYLDDLAADLAAAPLAA